MTETYKWQGNYCEDCNFSLVEFEETEKMKKCWECELKLNRAT